MNDRAVRQRRLGQELRRLRKDTELTAQEAADAIGISKSMMSLFETGGRVPQSADLAALLTLYGADEATKAATTKLFDEAKRRDWLNSYADVFSSPFRDYLTLEPEAVSIRRYEPQYVPGLLQTRAYARAMISADSHNVDMVDRLVDFRLARQEILWREDAPSCDVVLDESVLRRPIGGPAVMREQLNQLASTSQRSNVTMYIIPYDVIAFTGGPFGILRLPDPGGLDAVYLENLAASRFLDKPGEIKAFAVAFEQLRRAALDPAASVELISKAAEEMGAHG